MSKQLKIITIIAVTPIPSSISSRAWTEALDRAFSAKNAIVSSYAAQDEALSCVGGKLHIEFVHAAQNTVVKDVTHPSNENCVEGKIGG